MKQGNALSLPKGWEIKTLGEVSVIMNGGTPDTSVPIFWGGENLWITPKDMGKLESIYVDNTLRKITNEGLKNSSAKILPPNSIILSSRAPIGHLAINTKPISTNQGCKGVVPKKGVDTLYLYYFLSKSVDLLNSLGTGTTFKELSSSKLGAVEIPLPPLPEQQRIVSILDEAFAAIAKALANAEQNLKNAKELFDVYLNKYYTSKEDGWEEKKLKEVAEYFNGLTYSPKDLSNEGIIVLRSSNVQNDELDFKDIVRVNLNVKEKIIVKEGDILMCSRNGSARLVGKTATIKNLGEEMTFGTFMMIVRSEYNPYLSWFFKSTDFRNQIKGGANTMINQITRYMLDDIILSFPPIEKQNEVVRQLDALSMEIKKLETIYNQKINDLEELKKSVLQKAFSGELRGGEPVEPKTAKALV
jgi:type I restriction enzyme S subunit